MRCMNEGCINHSTTQMNYCMQYHDTAKCDEAEPRNLPEANVKPQLCDVFVAFSAYKQGEGLNDKYVQLSVDMNTEEEAQGVIDTYKTTIAYSFRKPDYFILMKGNKNFA